MLFFRRFFFPLRKMGLFNYNFYFLLCWGKKYIYSLNFIYIQKSKKKINIGILYTPTTQQQQQIMCHDHECQYQ